MQAKLEFVVKPEDVTDELILKRCKSPQDAIKLCRDCSPLADKEILAEIAHRSGDKEVEKSHFSEWMSGARNFPPKYIQLLEDICGNWIPTRYMALSRNQELRPKREAWELENESLRYQLAEKDKEIEIIRKWEKEKRA